MENSMNIAIVTGASSGIGREFVQQISKKYPKLDEIWIIARRLDRLKELSDSIPTNIRILALNLTSNSDLMCFSNLLSQIKPKVLLLINAAGCGKAGPFEVGSYDEEVSIVSINCTALTAVTHLTIPYMCKHARIINIASVAAFLPQPDFAVYAASKSFVLSFSRALKYELLKRQISVIAVCPGPVDTEFFDVADSINQGKRYKKFFMTSPQKVVSKALKDASLDGELSIYGISMKLVYVFSKILPHKLILKLIYGRGK